MWSLRRSNGRCGCCSNDTRANMSRSPRQDIPERSKILKYHVWMNYTRYSCIFVLCPLIKCSNVSHVWYRVQDTFTLKAFQIKPQNYQTAFSGEMSEGKGVKLDNIGADAFSMREMTISSAMRVKVKTSGLFMNVMSTSRCSHFNCLLNSLTY